MLGVLCESKFVLILFHTSIIPVRKKKTHKNNNNNNTHTHTHKTKRPTTTLECGERLKLQSRKYYQFESVLPILRYLLPDHNGDPIAVDCTWNVDNLLFLFFFFFLLLRFTRSVGSTGFSVVVDTVVLVLMLLQTSGHWFKCYRRHRSTGFNVIADIGALV